MPRRRQQDDVEDPRDQQLKQILALAEIYNTVQKPELASRELDIGERAGNLKTALGVLGLYNDIAAQKELSRYHTGELAHGEAQVGATREETAAREREVASQVTQRKSEERSGMNQLLIQSLGSHAALGQGLSLRALANAVREESPGLANVLDEEHTRDVNQKVIFNATQIGLMKGDQKKIAQHMAGITDPDVKSQLQPQVDAILNPQPQTGVTPAGTSVTPSIVPVGHPAPPTVNVDELLQHFVGGPTMEDLRKRQLSSQAVLDTANTRY